MQHWRQVVLEYNRMHLGVVAFFLPMLGIIFCTVSQDVWAVADSDPIHIAADHMESIQKDESVFFAGNVEARQGELAIKADEMTVYYDMPAGDDAGGVVGRQRVRKLAARGNVKIIRDNWVATGDEVVYWAADRKVLLSGNTKIRQEGNMVSGDRVILYLDEGRSVVERNDDGERVQGIFYPKSDE